MIMHQRALGEGSLHLESFITEELVNISTLPELDIRAENFAELEEKYKEVLHLYRIGQYKKGISILDNCTESIKNNAVYHFTYGLGYFHLKDFQLALEKFKKAIAIKPNYTLAHYNIATSLYAMQKYILAEKKVLDLIKKTPKYNLAYGLLGNIYVKIGDFEKSIDAYTKSVELDSTNYNLIYNLGLAYSDNGNHTLAIENYELAIQLKSDFYEAYGSMGNSYLSSEQFDKAINMYKKVIEINPKDSFANWNILLTLIRNKQFNEAKLQWNEIKNSVLNRVQLYENLGFIFMIWIDKPNLANDITFNIFEEILNIINEKIDDSLATYVFHEFLMQYKGKTIEYTHFHQKYMNQFGKDKRLTLTNKYFDIGMRYLIHQEERAIYEFTKEERAVFLDAIMNQNENYN